MNAGTLDLLDLPLGQTVRVTAQYHGLEYAREVVRADAWEPSLGEPLKEDRFFRIVFLQEEVSVGPNQLRDARVVVWVPPADKRQRDRTLEQEQRILKEVKARYAVPETAHALQETQRQIYSSGSVVSSSGTALSAQRAFQGESAVEWVSEIAGAILSWTYPQLPLDSSAFSRSMTEDDAKLIFRGVLQEDTSPDMISAVEMYGNGLGLTLAKGKDVSDIQDCPTFHLLRDQLAQRDGSWPCDDVYQRMTHVHGLPHWLVNLYLLAFVFHNRPLTELHLKQGHSLKLRTGAPYQGMVVVSETVTSLEFPYRLESESQLLRHASPVSWNTLTLYFSNLEPSLTPLAEPGEPGALLTSLLKSLGTLRADVKAVEKGLEELSHALGEEIPGEAKELLNRFQLLSQTSAPETALQSARQQFRSPEGLSQAIGRYRALRQISGQGEYLADIAQYVRSAHVPEESGPLALERQSLLEVLRLTELLSTPFSPVALDQQVSRFQEGYRKAYMAHHEDFARESASLLSQLQEAQVEAHALALLNGISELGEPVGSELVQRVRELTAVISVCVVTSDQLHLDKAPKCHHCAIELGQNPPSQDVLDLAGQVKRGLREQNQRLSQQVVQRILDGPRDERLDRFIQVVQASDVFGLVNVLDQRLAQFVREVLSG